MRERLRRFLKPREGWTSLALLGVMLVMLAWSLQRAEWVDHLDYLVPVAMVAALAGTLLGLTRLSVALVLPVSAVLGAGFTLWTISGEYFPEVGQGWRLILLRGDALDWTRIVVDGGFAPQHSPYAIGLGVLMWVTAFMAAYTLYRHHRVLDSILLVGVALIANLSATFTPLIAYLVVFSIAALLLWLRIALVNREENWRIRRVNENLDVPAQIMRSGVTFIAGSIALAWVLTTVAVAAPLTRVWSNLDGLWTDVRTSLEGAFGGLAGTDSRIQGTNFGTAFRVRGSWTSSDSPVMTVASQRGYYMRTVTYDIYTGHGWSSSEGSDRRVAAGKRIFPGDTPERPFGGFVVETVTVEMQRDGGRNVFTPGFPTIALSPLVVHQPGGLPLLGALQSGVTLDEGRGYQITAAISNATEAMLVSAGTDYPPEIVATYTSTDGVTGRTALTANDVISAAGATDPYHKAKALADYLRSDPRFTYATVAALPSDPNRDLVDFFLFDKDGQAGYCEYFATTMAVMARTVGLPSRVAVGYAPGERVDTGIYQVRDKNAHLWAEVYFPGYGWQIFEATKSVAPLVRLSGSGIVPPINPPVGGVDPGQQFEEGNNYGEISTLPSYQPVEGGFQPGGQPPDVRTREGNAWVIIGLLMLLAGVVAYRLLRGRYRFRFLAPGDRQWQRLAFAADRAGVAQRPSETVYEYAGWLQEQIPKHSVEIHEIADGKVWQSYSGHSVSSDAIARLERAWGRLQLPLLWLALRRRIRSLFDRGAF
ncbi:MAG TPA: transglutaminaseTgpA domain-containing protein [Candidatus Limnocylindria bacterium]|nr:transglutaminaseTgpA domain-containing protein [Candidatus Limnocylindria bacterium]